MEIICLLNVKLNEILIKNEFQAIFRFLFIRNKHTLLHIIKILKK